MGNQTQATELMSVPTGSRVMRMSSPERSVKLSGGTVPVPVIRYAPRGTLFSQNYPSASEGSEPSA